MLDECKGERLEEILAVFSNAVLKKVLQERAISPDSIAQQLSFENFSYTGERTVLSTLILAHKVSLHKQLSQKNNARAQYADFSDLLNLNDRRIARRQEELKQFIEERGTCDSISGKEIRSLQDDVRKNWSGSNEWMETLLYGDSKAPRDALLGTQFDTVWKHVESGSIGDIEGKQHIGLVEQLDARIRDQESRLARWQNFGRTLSKPENPSPSKKGQRIELEKKRIDLGFSQHQKLQIDCKSSQNPTTLPLLLEEYTRLIENMNQELMDVDRMQTPIIPTEDTQTVNLQHVVNSSITVGNVNGTPSIEEEWCSATDTEAENSQLFDQTRATLQTPPTEAHVAHSENNQNMQENIPPVVDTHALNSPDDGRRDSEIEAPLTVLPPPLDPLPEVGPLFQPAESESDLADQILNSVSASSPSPKKPRHTLSLAERTRLSMSRASHSKYSDLHDDVDNVDDLTRLSIRPQAAQPVRTPTVQGDEEKHAALIERTRKSMAGFEAAQKKAQLERRRSVKDAKKKQRESNYFPKVDEEPMTPSISAVELIDEDPDYEMVFKSRPKIKTSPAVSPTRIWEESE